MLEGSYFKSKAACYIVTENILYLENVYVTFKSIPFIDRNFIEALF